MIKKLFIFIVFAFFGSFFVVFAQSNSTTSLELTATLAQTQAYGVVGKAFVLDGTKSADDGTIRTFNWEQVSGPYKFNLGTGVKTSVVPPTAGTYEFELIAIDRAGTKEIVQKIKLTVTSQAQTNSGGTQDINIGIGENAAPTASATPKPSSGSGGGNVEFEWKVEEGEKGTTESNDRLVNAGPKDGWPTGGISVAAGDVNGLTEEEKTAHLTAVKEWAEIKSEQDLKNFATGVLLKDVQLKGVNIKENLIEVDYSMPSRLLGFIPFGYTVRVSVDRGDNENWDFSRTKVKFPWFSSLLKKGFSPDEIKAELEQEGGVQIAVGDVNGDGTAAGKDHKDWINVSSFSSAAQTFNSISNVLKTKHDTVKNSIGNVR